MNFTALDIIHFWTDSRKKMIQKIFPTNRMVCVYCTNDLSAEATKVCHFLNLILNQPWTFQMKSENGSYVITFSLETVSLVNLFQAETQNATTLQKTNQRVKKQGAQKTPREKREMNAGDDSNQLNLKCNL